jgi:hypothetical protein
MGFKVACMTLYLIKLCVGCETIAELAEWQASGRADFPKKGAPHVAHFTFQIPKRTEELTAGGSLYWVIKGRVQVRQALVAIEAVRSRDGRKRCALVMDRKLVATRPRPHRPFQGWRYLKPEDAPADLGPFSAADGDGAASLKAELVELGLI